MNFRILSLMAAPAASAEGAAAPDTMSQITSLVVPLLLLGFVFYFIIYRPQKKQEKAVANLRNSLAVGDEITTTGGIIGKVTNIKDDTITLETGADKVRIKIQRWALHTIDKKSGAAAEPLPEPEEKKSGYKVKSVKKKPEAEEENK